jgi:hypothetical protein
MNKCSMGDQQRLATWAAAQCQALLTLGLPAQDAQAAVAWVLRHLPADADPDTWIPPPDLLDEPLDLSSNLTIR